MCGIGGFVDYERDARRGGPILHGMKPVSYTHLDVYKRQQQGRAQPVWPRPDRRCQGGQARPCYRPVSYTHLDVYKRQVYKHLKRLLRSCGMGDYTFHSLRHSFATISLENGDDIKTVQTNLGHSTAAFTLKTYAHVSDQMQRSSAARMEELISSLEAVN